MCVGVQARWVDGDARRAGHAQAALEAAGENGEVRLRTAPGIESRLRPERGALTRRKRMGETRRRASSEVDSALGGPTLEREE